MYSLVPDAYAHCTHQILTRMLSAGIRFAECTLQFLMLLLSARISSLRVGHLKNGKTDAHAEHERKELMRMLRVHIIS